LELGADGGVRFLPVASYQEIKILSQSDPTDDALAAIANILDHPESHREPERTAVVEKPFIYGPIEAEGYQKVGPGPIAAIRFKWTVRRDGNDDYYVHETIGENSAPVVEGPMSGDAAIKFVDDRESEARRRFELLKSEMTGRSSASQFTWKDGGEI
jgi:hypothetical protein